MAQFYLMLYTQLQTHLDVMVGAQLLLLWFDLQASSCSRPFARTSNKTASCCFSCLQGLATAHLGMAITMYINQSGLGNNIAHA
jgi:hypothetical protein